MCDNSELSCWNFYNRSQWGVYDFPMLEVGDIFGINTDLRINHNSIPHTGRRGRQPHWGGAQATDVTTFRKICMSKWKNWNPYGGAPWIRQCIVMKYCKFYLEWSVGLWDASPKQRVPVALQNGDIIIAKIKKQILGKLLQSHVLPSKVENWYWLMNTVRDLLYSHSGL